MAKRLLAEKNRFSKNGFGATLELVGDDINNWIVSLPGPAGSFYEGHIYKIQITFPARYPFEKPSVCFVPSIYHPNIDKESGEFCIGDWSPTKNALTIVELANSLLKKPEPGNATNAEAAELFRTNTKAFEEKVKASIKNI